MIFHNTYVLVTSSDARVGFHPTLWRGLQASSSLLLLVLPQQLKQPMAPGGRALASLPQPPSSPPFPAPLFPALRVSHSQTSSPWPEASALGLRRFQASCRMDVYMSVIMIHIRIQSTDEPPTWCAGRCIPAEKLWQGLWCERTSHRWTAPSKPAVARTWGRSGHHARSFTGLQSWHIMIL